MEDKLTPQQIRDGLGQFYGSEFWYTWNVLFPRFLLTDGAKFVADQCGAYWLMDLIASYQRELLKNQYFQVWKLAKPLNDSSCVVWCENGNNHELARQEVPYTDFPLESIELYAIYDGEHLTILLPGEY